MLWKCCIQNVSTFGKQLWPQDWKRSVFIPIAKKRKWSRSVVSDSLQPHGLLSTRLLCPWDFPGKNTRVGCHFLLQELFPTQGLNLGLPHCRHTLYRLSHQGSIRKESQRKAMPKNGQTNAQLHSSHMLVMLKILQGTLQQYVNHELPDVQAGFRKGKGNRHQIVNIHWIIEKARDFQKNIYFCFLDLAKAFDCMDHNKLWKILQETCIPDHLTCLLRNLYAGQEATVRTWHGTMDWFQTGKAVHQGYISSPCLFNLYAQYIMRNAGLDEAQAGIKIAGRNINNLDMQMTPPLRQKA